MKFIVSVCLALLFSAGAYAQSTPQLDATLRTIPPAQGILAHSGMVVAQESRAARIGVEILDRGGNAVDAAVAVGFALAVTYPRAGNLGGGGFMVIHLAKSERNKDNKDIAIDYRETAPAAATESMFLDAQGNPDPKKSRDSGLAVGVPGTVAGLALAHEKYGSGKLSLADLIEPALRLAQDGFPVEDDTADSLPIVRERLARWPSTKSIFFIGEQPLGEGDRLIQTDLADTLSAIAKDGPRAFYQDHIAQRIADAVNRAGGVMTAADLANYHAIERPVVRGTYRGYDIVSMPPPSSGGVHLIEMLNILEGYDLGKLGRGAESLHLMIEAMKRAYADRAAFMGDPDAVKMPIAGLISKSYAASLRGSITDRATPSASIRAGKPADYEGRNTTHFSVIDRDGNAVSNTYTLNFSYGLGLVADGTGVLLNNELDDFTAKPGASNAFGLVGYTANLPGPNKRPLSSMSPTIVLKDGKPVLITGSPGGSRIITTVLQVITNVIDFHMPIAEAVSAPRLHQQWQPEDVFVEPGFAPSVLDALRQRGYIITPTRPASSANSIAVTPQGIVGAADPRTRGALAAGY
ncbi:gamma-glutamyltransferase [Pseudolabrys taiwanensis]|uniref:Glutathione hydrolase proenzyme n=1 Tax=Pseudolabrys taiwanensis TaxID=331696 RepID=A0A345ZZY4_9HYPH|nr:gamma-glutamyltransferase [Pseudolabrys taiwanensis]AXK82481.1 gamma-glutamyltransferase [Pseudolabrys taiwanensis]